MSSLLKLAEYTDKVLLEAGRASSRDPDYQQKQELMFAALNAIGIYIAELLRPAVGDLEFEIFFDDPEDIYYYEPYVHIRLYTIKKRSCKDPDNVSLWDYMYVLRNISHRFDVYSFSYARKEGAEKVREILNQEIGGVDLQRRLDEQWNRYRKGEL